MKEKSITPEGIINQAMGMNMSFTGAEFPVEIFPSKFNGLYTKCTNVKVTRSITRLPLS